MGNNHAEVTTKIRGAVTWLALKGSQNESTLPQLMMTQNGNSFLIYCMFVCINKHIYAYICGGSDIFVFFHLISLINII